MNQNILIGLERQAEKLVLQIPAALDSNEYTSLFNEKFAELIVRECFGEVMCQLYDYSPSSNEQYNAGHEAGLKLAVNKIKQHFGVEE